MERDRATYATTQEHGSPSPSRLARGAQRHLLRGEERLPVESPPSRLSTLEERLPLHYFRVWRINGRWERLNTALREQLRQKQGRHKQPSAAVLDSQARASK